MTTSSRTSPVSRPPGEHGAAGYLLTPPAQAALLGFSMYQNNLRIWRSFADSMRDSIRGQQDAMLRLLLERTSAADSEQGKRAEAEDEGAANGASTFFMPALAVRRAYVQMSGAMIDAQRQALASLVQTQMPH